MQFVPADAGPFLILWYFFLAFMAVVLIVNGLCLAVAAVIQWRIRRLYRKRATQ